MWQRRYTEGQMVECPAPHRVYPERVCGGNFFRVNPLTYAAVRIPNGIKPPGAIRHKCRYCHTIIEIRVSTEVV